MTNYTWKIDADGNWTTPGDWTPSGPPSSGSDVTISTTDFHTVTLNSGTVKIANLTLGADELVISGGASLVATGTLTNAGTVSVQAALLALSGGGTIVNDAGAVLQLQNGAYIGGSSGGNLITNAGVIQATAAAHVTIGVSLANTGTIEVTAGAALTLSDGGASSANGLDLASTGTLDFAGGSFTVTGGTFNSAGLVEVSGGSVDFSAATIANLGQTFVAQVDGGTLTLGAKSLTLPSLTLAGGALSDRGTLTVTGAASLRGNGVLTGGSRVVLKSGSTDGGLDLDDGEVLENQSTLTVAANGVTVLGLNPTGSVGGGTIVNDAGATLLLQNYAYIRGYKGSNLITNAGLIQASGATSATIGVALTNTGTLEVGSGDLDLEAYVTNTGTLAVGVGAELTVSDGGASNAGALNIASTGTLDCAGGLFTLTGGTFNDAGLLEVDGGTADFSGTTVTDLGSTVLIEGDSSMLTLGSNRETISSLTISGGVVSAGSTLTVTGVANLTNNAVLTGGGRVLLKGSSTASALFLDGGEVLENTGTLVANANYSGITLGENPFQPNNGVGGGTIVNDSGALMLLQNYEYIHSYKGTNLISNAGLIEATGAVLETIGVSLTNSGTLEATSPFLILQGFLTNTGMLAIGSNAEILARGGGAIGGVVTGPGTLQIGAATSLGGLTISSAASVTNTSTGFLTGQIELGNATTAGTFVNAAGADFELTNNSGVGMGAASGSSFTNAGDFYKTGGTGTSVIAADFVSTGTVDVGTGTLEFTGASNSFAGTILGTGTIQFGAGTSTLGGTVVSAQAVSILGSGTDVTLSASLAYAGKFTASAGRLALGNKVLTLSGAAGFTGGTITGTGHLSTEAATTLAALSFIGGAGWGNYGTVTETGTLTLGGTGTGGSRLSNETGAVFNITGTGGIGVAAGGSGNIVNNGLIEKTVGTGTSTIGAAIANNGGTIAVTAGTLDLVGALTYTGKETIGKSGTLKFDGAVGTGQTISFAGTTGGELVLNDPSGSALGFAGKISGFGGSDQLDLATFAYVAGTKPGWVQNGSGGTLTVTEGSKTAKITLFGQYAAAGFSAAKDAAGDTLITYTAPAQVVSLAPSHH